MDNENEYLKQAIMHLVEAVEIINETANENRVLTILNSKTIEALAQRMRGLEKENAKLKEELKQLSLLN